MGEEGLKNCRHYLESFTDDSGTYTGATGFSGFSYEKQGDTVKICNLCSAQLINSCKLQERDEKKGIRSQQIKKKFLSPSIDITNNTGSVHILRF